MNGQRGVIVKVMHPVSMEQDQEIDHVIPSVIPKQLMSVQIKVGGFPLIKVLFSSY